MAVRQPPPPFPAIRLAKYVDDISITSKGPRDDIADLAVEATE